MNDYELEQSFCEMLDECYSTIKLFDVEYNFSQVLKETDPIAFRVAMSDWESTLEEEEE